MRKSIIIVVFIALFLCIVTPAFGDQNGVVHHQKTLHLYTTIRLSVSFQYTENLTCSNVTTTNQTGYQLLIDTVNKRITFSTDAVDIFTFSITLRYPFLVSQRIYIDMTQGSAQAMDEDILDCYGDTVILDFKVIATLEQHFPTAEELTNLYMQHAASKQDINDAISFLRANLDVLSQNSLSQWVLTLAAFMLSVAVLVVSYYKRPKELS